MAQQQSEYKPSTIRIIAIVFVAVITVINVYSMVQQGGPQGNQDYLAIALNIGCIIMSGVIIRNEKKRKAEYEESQKQKLAKRQRRRENKRK